MSVPVSDYDALAEELQSLARHSALVYLPNASNWGGALTREATRRFFHQRSIRVREIARLNIAECFGAAVQRATLVYGGGGAWSELYPGGLNTVRRALRWFRRVVVLPSSYGLPVDLPRCQLWARDRANSLRHAPTARFCHDLGFSLESLPAPTPTSPRGDFFRSDALAGTPDGLASGREPDFSTHGSQDTPLRPFLDEIARHAEIHTDRVHVAIAACLLGRPCHVYATRTPLLADLYEASIGPCFPQAVFHARPDARAV
jgi:hypothetical protein